MSDPSAIDPTVIASLEAQAARLRSQLDAGFAKRPLIVEFSGLPKAGKTRLIGILYLFLKRNGFNVEVFTERASISPIKTKGHLNFNTWVSCASLQGMLEALSKPELDIFILDRGVFDALVWTHWLVKTGKITTEEADVCDSFFSMNRWAHLVDLVFIVRCDPKTSIERELADQLTCKPGNIMSKDTLEQLDESLQATQSNFGPSFRAIESIDTTGVTPMNSAVKITQKTLDVITDFIDECICVIPVEALPAQVPSKGLASDPSIVDSFVQAVNEHKRFVRRSNAEEDPNVIQPIACAIIRWQDKILILKRNKKGHSLHDKYLLWAGGHVNSSDDSESVLNTALERELSEEIFIKATYRTSGRPIALLRTDENARASRHIGVLYEITLTSPDVALAMHQKEFRETRGTSMSGKLIDSSRLCEFYESLNDWSKFMAEYFWPTAEVASPGPLFSE